jgi:hypothetical protein
LIVRVETLDTVREEFVEDERDTSSSRKLVESEIRGRTVDCCSEVTAEFGDDLKDDARLGAQDLR